MIPTPKQRTPARRRYIPKPRPDDTFWIRDETNVVTYRADLDHVHEINQAISHLDNLDAQLLPLERRMSVLVDRLADPVLSAQYPADHPVRIEAEDRLTVLSEQWQRLIWAVDTQIAEIETHGRYLIQEGNEQELESIGRQLIDGHCALGRVQAIKPNGLYREPWPQLIAAACPF